MRIVPLEQKEFLSKCVKFPLDLLNAMTYRPLFLVQSYFVSVPLSLHQTECHRLVLYRSCCSGGRHLRRVGFVDNDTASNTRSTVEKKKSITSSSSWYRSVCSFFSVSFVFALIKMTRGTFTYICKPILDGSILLSERESNFLLHIL